MQEISLGAKAGRIGGRGGKKSRDGFPITTCGAGAPPADISWAIIAGVHSHQNMALGASMSGICGAALMTPGVTALSSAPQGDRREMENGEVTRRCSDYGGKKAPPPKNSMAGTLRDLKITLLRDGWWLKRPETCIRIYCRYVYISIYIFTSTHAFIYMQLMVY